MYNFLSRMICAVAMGTAIKQLGGTTSSIHTWVIVFSFVAYGGLCYLWGKDMRP